MNDSYLIIICILWHKCDIFNFNRFKKKTVNNEQNIIIACPDFYELKC